MNYKKNMLSFKSDMNTFQSIVLSVIYSFTDFFPVSSEAHMILIPRFLNWPEAPNAFLEACSLGTLISLLLYFRHDWASLFSSFVQVILFRKRPMTLDERLPFFILISFLPYFLLFPYAHTYLLTLFQNPYWISLSVLFFAFPLWSAGFYTRKQKGMFDWNIWDALWIGIIQTLSFVPGCGRMASAMIGGLSRGYHLEVALKYSFYSSFPILLFNTLHYRHLVHNTDLSLFTFGVTVAVSCLTGILVIGSLMKQAQTKKTKGFLVYRVVFTGGCLILLWLKF